ncbi:hypothetical protein [Marinitenerispora sediminis]|uniref:Uncharacterized protein n=1 Tax=Marinitenerispora sediminis TaxID=1931232 RepID=A0A368TAH0_9ACTN|nr:hypothetical protein [Marinitenerispora sediminis]RCV52863.1 hypothetical protein DEF28_11955 [Marinitenerispora sediminis]RCV60039.1 hypothetical protein DEF23_05750 [Marinitenerispora sediminis]RCV61946.1 hypothetical protein DEF24_03055 [Marinitenerispora sediminis]
MSELRNNQRAEHEVSHMSTALCFGAVPDRLWLSLDGSTRQDPATGFHLVGGAGFTLEAELQVYAISAMAGHVGEIDLLARHGVSERSHPRRVSLVREVHPRHDHAALDAFQRRFPEDVIDRGRAAADAARMLGTERLRAANRALRRQLLRHGELDPDQIQRVAAPFELHTFLADEGIRVWLPPSAEEARSAEADFFAKVESIRADFDGPARTAAPPDFFDQIERLRGDFGLTAPGRGAGALDTPRGLSRTPSRGPLPPRRPPASDPSRHRTRRRSGPGL